MLLVLAAADAISQPRGWIGTTDDWARGLGVVFVALDLLLLFVVWRRLRSGLSAPVKETLALALGVLPLAIVFFSYTYGIRHSMSLASCGSCHVMKPYAADLQNPLGDGLAAVHFKNRYIHDDPCYTCHTDYGMFGTLAAKVEGLGHVVRHSTGRYSTPLKIAHPYPNGRCIYCHGESLKFLKSEGHPEESLPGLRSGETSCLECHGPAHTVSGGSK